MQMASLISAVLIVHKVCCWPRKSTQHIFISRSWRKPTKFHFLPHLTSSKQFPGEIKEYFTCGCDDDLLQGGRNFHFRWGGLLIFPDGFYWKGSLINWCNRYYLLFQVTLLYVIHSFLMSSPLYVKDKFYVPIFAGHTRISSVKGTKRKSGRIQGLQGRQYIIMMGGGSMNIRRGITCLNTAIVVVCIWMVTLFPRLKIRFLVLIASVGHTIHHANALF